MALEQQVAALVPLLASLHKFDSTFSPQTAALLSKSEGLAQALEGALQHAMLHLDSSEGRVAAYLTSGVRYGDLQPQISALAGVLQHLAACPLPRRCKDELGTLRNDLSMAQVPAHQDQARLAAALDQLYQDAVNKRMDVDTVEGQVDGVVVQVLQHLYDDTTLTAQQLHVELEGLERAAAGAGAQGSVAAVLRLAHNSLSRLHVSHLVVDDEDEEGEGSGGQQDDEEDEDDPFYMPLPSGAFKLADEQKFASLAQPIGPVTARAGPQPMLQMDTDDALHTQASLEAVHESGTGAHACLTAADFELVTGPNPAHPSAPVSPTAATSLVAQAARMSLHGPLQDGLSTAVAAATALHISSPPLSPLGAGAAGAPSATPLEPQQELAPPQLAAAPSSTTGSASQPATAAEPAAASAVNAAAGAEGTDAQDAAALVTPAVQPVGDEKHAQFVSFLQGQNPGACMFHAQMRLSLEGCRKLSNFLSNSNRVRALSLSHNYLGDDGMAIICEGLRQNSSVTAIDLPDNNISDAAAALLAAAVAHNQSLTQIQLAYNKIGDKGAAALAELIRGSTSLKKLGLSHNSIGKAGCQALTAAISANESLQQLQLLPGNPVDEKDAKALAKAMKRTKKFGTTLRSLLGL